MLGKYSKHSGEIGTYMQGCSEGFVYSVYRDIKAAVSFVRAGGNLVLLSLRGLRNPTQGNRTHPKILPSQVTIVEGKTCSRFSLRNLSTQVAARICEDVSVAVGVGEVWKQQKSASGWASLFPSSGSAKLWKTENKRQTGEQGKKVLERNLLLQEAQWFVVKQTAVLLFPC